MAGLSDSTIQYLQRRSNNARFAALEADLMPTLVQLRLDQARSTYVGSKGNLTVWLTEQAVGARKKEPCLLIANKSDPANRNFIILLGQLWIVLDPEGPEAKRNAAAFFAEAAQMLFGFVTSDDTFRVIDTVYEFAQDLVHAKPPTWMTHAQWLQALAEDDMTVNISINGQQVG